MRSLFRIIKFSAQSMMRNFWLSFVTVTVFVLTLVMVNSVIVLNVLANASVKSVEGRVQVTVYFTSDASTDVVKNTQSYLLGLSQVKEISYLTADEALTIFKEAHSSDPVILAALDEVDGNPFGQALKIRAYNASDFPFILQALEAPEYKPFIKEKNYDNYESALRVLSNFSERIRLGFLTLAIFFGFIAMLIVFNTIRVAIYVHREEIGIMKLVGANDWFIRGPFLLESIFFALLATGIMAGIVALSLSFANPALVAFFEGVDVNLITYYSANALSMFGAQFGILAFLGLGTTAFAMRKYLRV